MAPNNGFAAGELQRVPAWVATMQQAAMSVIKEEDIKAIVQNQIEKAKKGDAAAIKFVFDQVLGGPLKGAKFVQHNHYGPAVGSPADGERDAGGALDDESPLPPRVPPTRSSPRNPFK